MLPGVAVVSPSHPALATGIVTLRIPHRSHAEVARVLVGTSDPNVQTRPFIPSFTLDGRFIIVPNFRANNVSIVDLALALAHDRGAEVARIPLIRPPEADGQVLPARPKGSAVTSDGRYAVIRKRQSFDEMIAGERPATDWKTA